MAKKASLQDVEKVDQKAKVLMSGYIRSCQKLLPDEEDNPYYIIPTLVIHWCLLYFYSIERFAVFGKNMFSVDVDGKIIKSLSARYAAAFLTEIVDEGVHRWNFQVIKHRAKNCTIHVGVWKNKFTPNISSLISKKGKSYCYLISHGSLSFGDKDDSWGGNDSFRAAKRWRCDEGDVVEMILDLNKLELRYIIPDVAGEIVAFTEIENTAYRAAIGIFNSKDSIEFISYQREA